VRRERNETCFLGRDRQTAVTCHESYICVFGRGETRPELKGGYWG